MSCKAQPVDHWKVCPTFPTRPHRARQGTLKDGHALSTSSYIVVQPIMWTPKKTHRRRLASVQTNKPALIRTTVVHTTWSTLVLFSPRPPRRIALEGHPRWDTEVRISTKIGSFSSVLICCSTSAFINCGTWNDNTEPSRRNTHIGMVNRPIDS